MQDKDDVTPTEVRTSGRNQTVINYKQFLKEYADAPASPPKKRVKVDLKLKWRPSKERIAAEKYRTKFTTKPTTLPKPVHRKGRHNKNFSSNPEPTPTTTSVSQSNPETALANTTILMPATSAETRDAIDTLLLLGELPMPSMSQTTGDDNALLVPILNQNASQIGTNNLNINDVNDTFDPNQQDPENPQTTTNEKSNNTSLVDQTPEPPPVNEDMKDINIPVNPVVTIKQSTAEPSLTDLTTENPEPTPTPTKKKLSFKQYGIKRKYKQSRKFKCKLCKSELASVQEYNQHYLDSHPPQPCPDCTHVFTSPRTLAKHCYTHAEYMYKCQDCGCGFVFKSQLESHRRVHLKMSGFVCFKPNVANNSKGNRN